MDAMTLYIGNKNYSSWSLRPWLALKHTGAPFHEEMLPLDRPDTATRISAKSPSGRVPALHTGDLVVWDSLAICEYLNERFPEAQLWPADAAARARARSVTAEMHSGFAALRQHWTMNIRRTPTGAPIDHAHLPAPVRADVDRILALWTDCRQRAGNTGPFLFGAFSIADCFYAPVVTRFRSYGLALTGPTADYAAAVWDWPAMKEWAAAAHAEPLRIEKYETPTL